MPVTDNYVINTDALPSCEVAASMTPSTGRFTCARRQITTPVMKIIKLLTVGAFAAAMMTASTFGTDDPHAKCCVAAKKAGKECDHPCCVQAKKDDKACQKCPPAEGEKKPS